jgi:hypothetical protein
MKRAADAVGLKNTSVPGNLMEVGQTLVVRIIAHSFFSSPKISIDHHVI